MPCNLAGEQLAALAVALAYRLEGADWKQIETKSGALDPDGAPDVDMLDTAKALPFPLEVLEYAPGVDEVEVYTQTRSIVGAVRERQSVQHCAEYVYPVHRVFPRRPQRVGQV